MNKPPLPDILRLPAISLAAHAYEHQRASGIISDQIANNWFDQLQLEYDQMPWPDSELTNGIITRSLVIDYAVLDFLTSHDRVVTCDLGCGFSTRKYRLEINRGHWCHCDFPDVLQARTGLKRLGELELAFGMDLTKIDGRWPLDGLLETTVINYLFILEGVLNHLPRSAALGLLRLLHERYPGDQVIGTVITEIGLHGAMTLASEMGLDISNMWAVESSNELYEILKPSNLERIWLLGKVASRIGLIRPVRADQASGLVFKATL